MNQNKLHLIGRVGWIGMPMGNKISFQIGHKRQSKSDQPVYDNFFVSAFGITAENFYKTVQKGDYVFIEGRLSSYKGNDNTERVSISASIVKKIVFDNGIKQWIEV